MNFSSNSNVSVVSSDSPESNKYKHLNASCFHQFVESVEGVSLPAKFTFPFYYQPHPLCVMAAKQIQQQYLVNHSWQHNFGIEEQQQDGQDTIPVIGKMFGVLLVRNAKHKLGFIAAFSGKLAEQNIVAGFVPPVFDLLEKNSFFLSEQEKIHQINQQLEQLESSASYIQLEQTLAGLIQQQQGACESLRLQNIQNRKNRKEQRQQLAAMTQPEKAEYVKHASIELSRQSVGDKLALQSLQRDWQQKCQAIQEQVEPYREQISQLKRTRKLASSALQEALFKQYRFVDQALEPKDLIDIFADTAFKTPPAGAGECAAPKLLQYAFLQGYQPLAMAEFWWGQSPKSEIRKHQQFYPACAGKCQPILSHMLQGLPIDENPLLTNLAKDNPLDILYQDQDIVVVNKPPELLSVPGKTLTDSVYTRVKQWFPEATGPLIVHRLDMATSGIMVLALHSKANKGLTKQFIKREVKKQYVALVEGLVTGEQGRIELPLRGDWYDRPKQLVCFEAGKAALTQWQVLSRDETTKRTKLALSPHTGRTHQLRVHCAHAGGLNSPIVGDDLYGVTDSRLHLHAKSLTFTHPSSGKSMYFQAKENF